MGILLLLLMFGYLALAAVLLGITVKFAKSKKIVILVAVLLVLFPLRRLIFYKTLFFYYQLSPLQEIHETVSHPGSVYWEDNVWPGYDERGRAWMVKTYLDGKHLQALALNGDDGKVYLYQASIGDFAASEMLRPAVEKRAEEISALEQAAVRIGIEGGDNKDLWREIRAIGQVFRNGKKGQYIQQKDQDLQEVMDSGRVFSSRDGLPAMNYTVLFNPIGRMTALLSKFLHGDEITITDNRNGKVVAFSKRYLAYAGFMSKISGEQPKFDYRLGDFWSYGFDDKVLFEFARTNRAGSEWHSSYLNERYDRRW